MDTQNARRQIDRFVADLERQIAAQNATLRDALADADAAPGRFQQVVNFRLVHRAPIVAGFALRG